MFFEAILARCTVQLLPLRPAGGAPGDLLLFAAAPGSPGAPLLAVCALLERLQRGNLAGTQAGCNGCARVQWQGLGSFRAGGRVVTKMYLSMPVCPLINFACEGSGTEPSQQQQTDELLSAVAVSCHGSSLCQPVSAGESQSAVYAVGFCRQQRCIPAAAAVSEVDAVETRLDAHNLQADTVWQAGSHIPCGLQPTAVDTALAGTG